MRAALVVPLLRGGAELKRTAAVLRAAGREDLLREVRKAVKSEAQPTLADLKTSALHVRITGERTGAVRKFTKKTADKHLRQRMADATIVEIKTSGKETRIAFHTVVSRMGNARVLPRYIDMGERGATTTGHGKGRSGWRHPIMGKRSRWAASQGEPWFFPPIKEHLPEFRERISGALDEIVKKVEAS